MGSEMCIRDRSGCGRREAVGNLQLGPLSGHRVLAGVEPELLAKAAADQEDSSVLCRVVDPVLHDLAHREQTPLPFRYDANIETGFGHIAAVGSTVAPCAGPRIERRCLVPRGLRSVPVAVSGIDPDR
mgnify:CR=1 FL=1